MKDLFKKALAEVIGTFVLVFVACGVAALTKGNLTPTALAFGLVIIAMAYSIGRISGCHINPAVSLGCALTKRMTWKEFGVYVCAQFIGATLGGVLMFGVAKMAGLELLGDACNYVVNNALNGMTFGTIMASIITEVVLTCIFVYVILNATDEKAGNSKIAGIIIGLTLTLVHLVGIGLTGTSVNPARSFGTAIAALIFNSDAAALSQVWIFIVAPLVGGALAALLYKLLHKEAKEETTEDTKEA